MTIYMTIWRPRTMWLQFHSQTAQHTTQDNLFSIKTTQSLYNSAVHMYSHFAYMSFAINRAIVMLWLTTFNHRFTRGILVLHWGQQIIIDLKIALLRRQKTSHLTWSHHSHNFGVVYCVVFGAIEEYFSYRAEVSKVEDQVNKRITSLTQ